jgi:SAM-dependent methyltransferase
MLDIGCGRGESLVAARRAGWTARGLDPSPRFAAEGRELFGVQIECAEIHDAEIDSASVDLVLLSGVLEHVYEPMALLTEAARVLRPGGLVVVDVPNERSLVQRAAQAYLRTRARDWTLALSPTFPPYHVIGFSRRALRFALSSAGLETLELSTYALRLDVHATGRAARMAARLELVAQRIGAASGLLAWARKPALES